tara:strand:- start:108 stop:329 length:222 start_codon:yes stop_codon:yes gene_type:complete
MAAPRSAALKMDIKDRIVNVRTALSSEVSFNRNNDLSDLILLRSISFRINTAVAASRVNTSIVENILSNVGFG